MAKSERISRSHHDDDGVQHHHRASNTALIFVSFSADVGISLDNRLRI